MFVFKVVEASDVILEVLDARDPLGCRCPQVEQAVIQSGTNKKIVLVLNKIGEKNTNNRSDKKNAQLQVLPFFCLRTN